MPKTPRAQEITENLFSLTGIPPFADCIGQLYLFAAILSKGGTLVCLLAMVGIVNSLISRRAGAGAPPHPTSSPARRTSSPSIRRNCRK